MSALPRFAAIDVGSNAIRIKVVETSSATHWKEVHASRQPVRLGREVFLTGQIAPASADAAAAAFRGFREALAGVGSSHVRAVGTSAMREAKNKKSVVDRIERESQIRVEIIEGLEEARLIRLGVDRAVELGQGRVLLIDVGGGSVELTGLSDGAQRFASSLQIGTVRLHEAFLGDKPVTRSQEMLLREYLNRVLEPALVALGPLRPTRFIGTGGNLERLAVLCPVEQGKKDAIDTGSLRELGPKLARMSAEERRTTYQLREDRADVIVPASYVLTRIADALGAQRIAVPGVGLRDGVLCEMVEKHYGVWDYRREADALLGGARALGRRFQFDEAHGEHTMKLAARIFDDLKSLHGLGAEERLELSVAALLHDVGDFIANGGHHKHSHYIIQHSDIGGLPPERRRIVANVARYHRGADPQPDHPNLAGLDKAEIAKVRKLAAILRVAEALDREHREKVSEVSVSVDKKRVVLRLRGEHDFSLEIWTVRRKAPLFEQVFDRTLEIEGPEAGL
ncbi:MAG: Ppx/GppA family phosphatase [Deltaproteobacteria bacterium]|nr:Ppx/GppA family phosphatase [Deltaproteobacteria bacterium]